MVIEIRSLRGHATAHQHISFLPLTKSALPCYSAILRHKKMQPKRSLLILIAGPYRSGTNDDPALIHANVKAMTDMALEVYRMGHLPVLGEWFALPLIEAAGSKKTGDRIFNEIFHPVAMQLIDHCDAILRIVGPSAGADEMVSAGRERGKTIFFDKAEIPHVFKKS
jgi:hypothetical protein